MKDFYLSASEIVKDYKCELENNIIPNELIPLLCNYILETAKTEFEDLKYFIQKFFVALWEYIYHQENQKISDYNDINFMKFYIIDSCSRNYNKISYDQLSLLYNEAKSLYYHNDILNNDILEKIYSEEKVIDSDIVSDLLMQYRKEEFKHVDLWQ